MNLPAFLLALLLGASALTAQVEQFGTPRPRAPREWTKFEWPEMRKVLFGMYAPTDEEIALIDKALPAKATSEPAQPRRILLFYRCQYPHASIATGVLAFQKLADTTGAFSIDLSDNPADFTPAKLAKYDAVLLNNTVGYEKIIGEDGCQALVEFVKSGKGLVGIHAAADACKGWPEGAAMMGGIFQCHPWLPKGTWAFQLETPEHPLNAAFKRRGFWFRDEIYHYRGGSHSRDRSRVLVGLDMTKEHNCSAPELHKDQKSLADPTKEFPVSWIHTVGQGRVFYSNFGHNNSTYWQPSVLKHFFDGIRYALGDLPADATPSSQLATPAVAPAPDH